MHHLSPADELAELRAEIARLKAREAALRADILALPPALLVGRWSQVVIERRQYAAFDAALLPPSIRLDPGYTRLRAVQVVRTEALPCRPAPRPGWPIRREAALH